MKKVNLGDVCTVVNGFAFDSSLFNSTGIGIPVIRIRDVMRGYSETFVNCNVDDKYIVKKGDLIVGMDGEFNISEWSSADSALNQRVCKLVTDDCKCEKKFLYHVLPKELKQIENKTAFVTVKHLSSKAINAIKIPFPPLAEQRRIATILDKADAICRKRQESLKLADAFVKSVFLEMFGDPVLNPKGWEVKPLEKMGILNRGVSKHRPRNDPKLLGGPYPLVQTGEVTNTDLYVERYIQTYSEMGLKQSKMWEKGTLCITIAANIAKTALLGFDACFPDSVVGFNANETTNNFFVHYWFSFFQKMLEEQAPESAQKNINLKILHELRVICPPLPLQNRFAEIVERVEAHKQRLKAHLAEAEQMKKALQQQFFE